MKINEFAEKVRVALTRELGGALTLELREVRKNNGVILHGLLIADPSRNVAPTVYLDSFLEAYEAGATFAAIVRRILEICREDIPGERVDMEFFRSFERVKDRICYRLIGRKDNRELLKEVPHIDYLDMAICFYYAYRGRVPGEGIILICNSHMEMWQTSASELFELARENTPRLFPAKCVSMGEILREAAEQEEGAIPQDGESDPAAEFPMRVLSNTRRTHGAVCILYPQVLEKQAGELQSSFYIIPSSVHEVILLTDTGLESEEELKKMIAGVNRTQVAPEEVLSDSLYYYDFIEKRMKTV